MESIAISSKTTWIMQALAKQLKLTSLDQLILLQTSTYYDCRKPTGLLNTLPDTLVYTVCKVQKIAKPKPNANFYQIDAYDFNATVFRFSLSGDSPFYEALLTAKQKQAPVHLHGKFKRDRYGFKITSPTIIPVSMRGKITPKLPSVTKLASAFEATTAYAEWLESDLDRNDLTQRLISLFNHVSAAELQDDATVKEYVTSLINRDSGKQYQAALKYFRSLNIKDYLAKEDADSLKQRLQYKPATTIDNSRVKQVVRALDIELTKSQQQAITDIVEDHCISKSGNGLISGDVGTGKSIVIAVVAVAAQLSGLSVAVMAPTPEIVHQLRELIVKAGGQNLQLHAAGVNEESYDNNKLPNIALGTTALLNQQYLKVDCPDICIIDEEHEFGSEQKYTLVAENTYQLLSTATAIPATMQIAMINRRKVFPITERHIERRVKSRLHSPDKLTAITETTKTVIQSGGQVAVVVPIVNKSDNAYHEALAVDSVFKKWNKAYPGNVALYHGNLSREDRAFNYAKIVNGEASIIVATSAMESGLNIPNLRQIIVLEPARYGLRQLHQLRGRVGRYGDESFFELLPIAEISESAQTRLNILVECDDGFVIAEKELKIRGFGALNYGDYEQNGHPEHVIPCLKITPNQIAKYNNKVSPNE